MTAEWQYLRKLVGDLSKTDKERLFSGAGPLATYSGRCDIVCALGLIPRQLRSELSVLGKVRNKFAHDFRKTDFNDPVFNPLFEQLKQFDIGGTPLPSGDRRMHYAAHCFVALTALFTIGQMLVLQNNDSKPRQQSQ
jgi:hypothetical protein